MHWDFSSVWFRLCLATACWLHWEQGELQLEGVCELRTCESSPAKHMAKCVPCRFFFLYKTHTSLYQLAFPYGKEYKLSWNEAVGVIWGVPQCRRVSQSSGALGTAVSLGTAAHGAARAASGAGGWRGARELCT